MFWGSPLVQFSKFNNFHWVCWFSCKNLSNFVYPVWKLYNLYCHNNQYWHTVYETGIAIWGKLNINAKWLLLGLTLRGYLCWIDHSRLWINAIIREFQDISYKTFFANENHLQKEHTFRLIEKKNPLLANLTAQTAYFGGLFWQNQSFNDYISYPSKFLMKKRIRSRFGN